eukprot:GGOE01054230.1.p1 GENE.GGOE01054230.1~~GGOE01054230.1.p1  ORF type:complete len:274 (-),score=42.81 GGOE01054230.1:236-1027(-)
MMDGGDLSATSEYLQKHNIAAMLEGMLHELTVRMPNDPVDFLIELLQEPSGPRVVMLGPPGAGKGTQAALLARALGVIHVSAADLLREEIKAGTTGSQEAADYMKRGELVSDAYISGLVRERLEKSDTRRKGWLLDGFPRTRSQALALQLAGHIPSKVVLLECPDEVTTECIENRRFDPVAGVAYNIAVQPPTDPTIRARLVHMPEDTRAVIHVRLLEFRRNLKGVLQAYEACQKDIFKINGNRSVDLVHTELLAAVSTPDEK